MGLTIHFDLRLASTFSLDEATAAIAKLWQAAKALPFQSQTEMVRLNEAQISHALADRSRSAWRWACVQHTRYHRYRYDTHGRPVTVEGSERVGGTCSRLVPAQALVGFTCLPGDGCEPLNVFVGRYPVSIMVECDGNQHGYPSAKRRLMLTKPLRWVGSAFCKTQYASQPEAGGVTNFLRCHLLVIALMEAARDLGFEVDVSDEGNYWERRSIPALVQEIADWNSFILGVGRQLRATHGDQVQTAIDDVAMAQPVNEPTALALGDDVLDLIHRTRGTFTTVPASVKTA